MDEYTLTIVSALIGALVAYVGAVLKNIIDTRTKLDNELFKSRNDTYKKLWEETKLVSKWPKYNNLKYSELKEYSNKLNRWYYEVGGIYMSKKAQSKYVKLQELIWLQLEPKKPKEKPGEQSIVDDQTYNNIHSAGSALRTELTNDLLSRRAPPSV